MRKQEKPEGRRRLIYRMIVVDDDVNAVNTEENPNNVAPVTVSGDRLEGGVLTATLPALSWNVIRLAPAK